MHIMGDVGVTVPEHPSTLLKLMRRNSVRAPFNPLETDEA